MPVSPLPYALQPLSFPFRHLASLAGRAPIGGAREVALACFVAARLAAECVGRDPLPDGLDAVRAAGAKGWMATLALPAPVRVTLARCLELAAEGSRELLGDELSRLSAAAASWLDAGARGELDGLAAALRR